MFCTNCGDLLEEGAVFCAKCGQRVVQTTDTEGKDEMAAVSVQEQIAAATPWESRPASTPTMDFPVQKPDNSAKKKWLWIALAAVLVAILAVGLANFKMLANSVRKLVMSPQEYYAYIEKKEVQEMASDFAVSYDNSVNAYADITNQSLEYSVDLTLGELICSLLSLEEVPEFFKMGVDFNLFMDEKMFFGEMAARVDDDRLISVNAVADLEKKMVYAQLPELSQEYISADISQDADQIKTAIDEYTSMIEVYPDGEALEGIMNRYLAIMIDSFETVTEEKDIVTVDVFEKKTTKLCATMTEAEVVTMLESICTELKSDEELMNMLVDYVVSAGGADEGTIRASIMEGIDKYLAKADTYRSEAEAGDMLSMTIWVDSKGEVIGREFAVDEDELVISYLMPGKGKEFGYQLRMSSSANIIEVTGTGTRVGSDMTGEFFVKMDTEETGEIDVATVKLEKLNLDKWEEGLEELSCRIKPDRDFYASLGAGAVASLLAGYELVYEVSTDKGESTASISVVNVDELLFDLDVHVKVDEAKAVTIPADSFSAESAEDLLNWMATIDFDKFMENISQSDMPAELVEIINAYVSEFKTLLYYE